MERDEVERVERELDEILSIVQPDQTARGSDIGSVSYTHLDVYKRQLSLVLLFAAGFITSFLELFLVIGTCGFLRHVERILLRQRSRISGH